ncbi:hypothetical protein [Lactiplantibacillus paraxiangfangensis]
MTKLKNTYDRVQPVTGTRLKDNQIKLRVYRKPQLTFWQQLKGWLGHE